MPEPEKFDINKAWQKWQDEREMWNKRKSELCSELVKIFAKEQKCCPICGKPMIKKGEFALNRWSYSLLCTDCDLYLGMEHEDLAWLLLWIIYYKENMEGDNEPR